MTKYLVTFTNILGNEKLSFNKEFWAKDDEALMATITDYVEKEAHGFKFVSFVRVLSKGKALNRIRKNV